MHAAANRTCADSRRHKPVAGLLLSARAEVHGENEQTLNRRNATINNNNSNNNVPVYTVRQDLYIVWDFFTSQQRRCTESISDWPPVRGGIVMMYSGGHD